MFPFDRPLHHGFVLRFIANLLNAAVQIFQVCGFFIAKFLFREPHFFSPSKCNSHIGIGGGGAPCIFRKAVVVLLVEVAAQAVLIAAGQFHRIGQNRLAGLRVVELQRVKAACAADEHIALI